MYSGKAIPKYPIRRSSPPHAPGRGARRPRSGDRPPRLSRDARRAIPACARRLAEPGVLDGALSLHLADLVRSVARQGGSPQDLPWALAGGELFLLQARPITELPRRPGDALPPGRWVKDAVHGSGPMSSAGA